MRFGGPRGSRTAPRHRAGLVWVALASVQGVNSRGHAGVDVVQELGVDIFLRAGGGGGCNFLLKPGCSPDTSRVQGPCSVRRLHPSRV